MSCNIGFLLETQFLEARSLPRICRVVVYDDPLGFKTSQTIRVMELSHTCARYSVYWATRNPTAFLKWSGTQGERLHSKVDSNTEQVLRTCALVGRLPSLLRRFGLLRRAAPEQALVLCSNHNFGIDVGSWPRRHENTTVSAANQRIV